MDRGVIPHFNTNARMLEACAARKPSKSTLKYTRAEIRLDGGSEGKVFFPGETVSGEFVLFKTKETKVIKDIYFNDLEIKFENRFKTVLGADATFFCMEDNPPFESLPRFAINPDKYPFESCSFPFSFTIPESHLEDTCVDGHPMHRNIVPSYGCPSLCGESFHATEVAGLTPTKSEALDRLRDLPFNQFTNYYTISCKVKQNIKGIDRPYVVFARSMLINVQSNFTPLPTRIDYSPIDLGAYYSIGDVNQAGELCIHKSVQLKSNCTSTGSVTVSSLLPSALGPDQTSSFPIDMKFVPQAGCTPPRITSTIELHQFTVQSAACMPPMACSPYLPFNDVPSFNTTKNNGKPVLFQRIQTIPQESTCLTTSEWTPDYDDPDAYTLHGQVSIPSVKKDSVLTSTFHSCHIQNIYCLTVTLAFDQENELQNSEQDKEKQKPKSRNNSLGSLLSIKRTPSSETTASRYNLVERNQVRLVIPMTVV